MPKILSQSGISLADAYDIEGSIAGVDQLVSNDVSLVHEMGSTLFSERYSQAIRRRELTAVNQSTNIEEFITDLPTTPAHIQAVVVMVDAVSRMSNFAVSLRDPIATREIPIWVWDATNEDTIRFEDDGSVSGFNVLRAIPEHTYRALTRPGTFAPQRVPELALRGSSSSFGAGTVQLTVLILIAFAAQAGVNSQGLHLPGW